MLPMFNKTALPLTLLISASLLSGCNSDDDNNAPTLTGESAPVVAENTVGVAQYTAEDTDGDIITFTISGQDSALFNIDQSGQLAFNTAPDFENDETGPYAVTVIATDDGKGELSSELSVSVTVGDETDTPSLAVVQTIDPDYLSSEVVFIDGHSQEINNGYYIKYVSDYTVASYKTDVYHIGRRNIDTISKYSAATVSERDSEIWSYSTQDAEDSISRNPYTLVSLSETKAYLIRYASSKVWIVNPQATTSEDFKIGELDLTGYVPENNSNNTPTPSAAVITDGQLYIVMQRLSDAWAPNTTYVAVFDTNTDEEIETNANSDDAVMGIPLLGSNPIEHSITSGDEKIYISSSTAYGNTDLTLSRIEEISPSDYSVRQVLNASEITDNVGAMIKSSVIISAEQGYFYTSEGYPTESILYQFNPTTGDITESNVAGSGEEAISYIGLDAANFLWVSVANASDPGVDIIDSQTNEKVNARLATELNPSTIVFIEE